jgi:hypothetical protein
MKICFWKFTVAWLSTRKFLIRSPIFMNGFKSKSEIIYLRMWATFFTWDTSQSKRKMRLLWHFSGQWKVLFQPTVNPWIGKISINCREWFCYHEKLQLGSSLVVETKLSHRERENRVLQREKWVTCVRNMEITSVRKRNRDDRIEYIGF